jgi:hypothetical protein
MLWFGDKDMKDAYRDDEPGLPVQGAKVSQDLLSLKEYSGNRTFLEVAGRNHERIFNNEGSGQQHQRHDNPGQ